jgi:hypothetical protein
MSPWQCDPAWNNLRFSPHFGKKVWASECIPDSAVMSVFHMSACHMFFWVFVFFLFRFSRRVTWKYDFYAWRLSM